MKLVPGIFGKFPFNNYAVHISFLKGTELQKLNFFIKHLLIDKGKATLKANVVRPRPFVRLYFPFFHPPNMTVCSLTWPQGALVDQIFSYENYYYLNSACSTLISQSWRIFFPRKYFDLFIEKNNNIIYVNIFF